MHTHKIASLLIGFAITGHSTALAQSVNPQRSTKGLTVNSPFDVSPENGFKLGLGLAVIDNSYLDGDNTLEAFPYIAYDTDRFHIGTDGASYMPIANDMSTLTLFVTPQSPLGDLSEGTDTSDMDRDTSINIGADYKFNLGPLYIQGRGQHGVNDAHKGYSLLGKTGVEFETGAGRIDFGGGITYTDKKLSAYHVGVNADEVTASRPAYSPKAALQPFAEVHYSKPIFARSTLLVYGRYIGLSDVYKNSPIIQSKTKTELGLGVVRSF